MADDNKTAAAVAACELTLALLFLNRWREGEGKKNARKYWPWQAWKYFNFDTLDELAEKDFVRGSHRDKSVMLTKTGMAEARRILEKYNIADWESLVGTEDWPAWLDEVCSTSDSK